MTKWDRLLKFISMGLGVVSLGFFVFDWVFLSRIRPRMVAFEPISTADEALMNWVGVGLLVFTGFCLASLLRMANYLRKVEKVTPLYVLLGLGGVISLLFVFGDLALINDIGKQYRHGLAQPEWSLLPLVMGFQVLTAVIYIFFHHFGFKPAGQVGEVARDSNIFQIVNFVGMLIGLMGLATSSLGFFFPRAWTLNVHTTISSIIWLMPYALVVGYWMYAKFQEKNRRIYDEKQSQDIGRSAFVTLLLSVAFMVGLFIANFNNLDGVISILWLPLYLFFILFLFSLGNVYFSWKE